MRIKKIVIALLVTTVLPVAAQDAVSMDLKQKAQPEYFKHLSVGVNVGTTGIGFELSSPVCDWLSLRAGFDFIPHFTYDMKFHIQVGDSIEKKFDKDGNRIKTKFDRMADYMEQLTGLRVNDEVDMVGTPNFNNFKLIADFHPFKNKQWYLSAGFYVSSSNIGRAHNTTEDMPTLLAVSIYNNIYNKVLNEEDIIDGIELPPDICEKFLNYGKMGMHIGDFKSDGSKYMMVPGDDDMVRSTLKANAFKPYIGGGYSGTISQDGRLSFAVNAGFLLWGGTPEVVIHDGVEMITELDNIWGQVGHYVDLVRPMKVFPMLNASLSYRLF